MAATIRAHPIIRHHLELETPGAIRGLRTVSTCDIAVLADRDPLHGVSTIMILTKEPMQAADPEPSMATDPIPAHPKATSPFGWRSPLAAGRARGGPFRGRGRGAYQKIIPAERELLRARRDGVDDENLVAEGDGGIVYRDVDELSDDEEADMEISDNSDGESGEPSTKRARRSGNDESGNSIPKWSNPDPYTALPPPDAAERKKKDMVKMIRKARVDETAADKLAASTEAEEFISFDLDEPGGNDNGNADEEEEIILPPSEPPSPPSPPPPPPPHPAPPAQASHDIAREPPSGPRADRDSRPAPNASAASTAPSTPANKPSSLPPKPLVADDALGSRKRTADDHIKPPTYGPLKKVNRMPVGGAILPEWQVTKDEDPTPWIQADHSKTSDMSVWLHKEIVDFYEVVRPRDFEHEMRTQLVERLRRSLRTTDMDLVVCAQSWLNGAHSNFFGIRALRAFGKFLSQKKITHYNSMEFIASAKVPLVKYIDSITGLRVDISFDRLDGPQAVKTFAEWKEQFPAMPILVTMIKHFLAMRGLNEPVNGGIGSFTVTCMVVSMLQLMPQVQSRNLIPEHHLGEMLMEFFDLYGNRFDYVNTAIRMKPPGYMHKVLFQPIGLVDGSFLTKLELQARVREVVYKNTDRISVIDPNNPANDISGGSSNAGRILEEFSIAHSMLKQRINELTQQSSRVKRSASILETIYAGNYSSFRLQRAHLRKLYDAR
ncbi:Topoisomerase family protein [Colletotrichum higginsianum IMI 349063]|uniref:polynucleotide adenylyltransferase n=2 Tax=Colletotrichum higginsianum (strain IMI 349063) TaxID=759273 RepID=A0A1B7YFH5_COLHI|nr:Topoisomerase family protein [Colletotrichum higginsianum IMI 349063]OBR10809.1 Topoisomerase family protein [Colletotrichum higginsianum IMI 349063]